MNSREEVFSWDKMRRARDSILIAMSSEKQGRGAKINPCSYPDNHFFFQYRGSFPLTTFPPMLFLHREGFNAIECLYSPFNSKEWGFWIAC
jgi:hypothetical protein